MHGTPNTEERSRELRSRGAELDAAARGAPGVRRLSAVREGRSPAKKTLGLVLLVTSYPLVAAGIEKALEDKADVRIGANSSSCVGCSPSCVVLCADAMEEGLVVEGMERVRKHYPYASLLVFGQHLDLSLAAAALKRGFVHAAMDPEQVARAIEVAQKGELAAPRQLLGYLLSQEEEETPDPAAALSPRKRKILELVVEGLSNAEIAGRLYLSESTIKQHLRGAYKLLGVRNRTEAAKAIKHHAHGL